MRVLFFLLFFLRFNWIPVSLLMPWELGAGGGNLLPANRRLPPAQAGYDLVCKTAPTYLQPRTWPGREVFVLSTFNHNKCCVVLQVLQVVQIYKYKCGDKRFPKPTKTDCPSPRPRYSTYRYRADPMINIMPFRTR